jgi:hypothetical protein
MNIETAKSTFLSAAIPAVLEAKPDTFCEWLSVLDRVSQDPRVVSAEMTIEKEMGTADAEFWFNRELVRALPDEYVVGEDGFAARKH